MVGRPISKVVISLDHKGFWEAMHQQNARTFSLSVAIWHMVEFIFTKMAN